MEDSVRERIARLEQIAEHQAQKINDQNKMIEKMSGKIDSMYDILSQGRGGWKVILAVAGVTAFVTTTVLNLLPFLPR